MINQFDFYYVEATGWNSGLKKLVGPDKISTKLVGWKTYPSKYGGLPRTYPVMENSTSLKFFGVAEYGGHQAAGEAADEFLASLPEIHGVNYQVKFLPRD